MKLVYSKTLDERFNVEIISYEKDNIRYSFMADPANSDYQRYLAWLENPEAEQSTPNLS